MLYIVRKAGESVIVNGSMRLTVLEVKGKSAKIVFEVPEGYSVLREELFNRISEENKKAMESTGMIEELFA